MKRLLALIPLTLVACGASYPAPNERMASSAASIRAAEEVDANKTPQAALHLKLAHEEIDQAKALMADDNNKRAEFVLFRADADAELAVALARETTTKAEAEKARAEVTALKGKVAP
ncbi:MAG: hypothetical protein JWM74_980 [Myxococcaceae bacterium]|nr:hypothetical protein [Myxococcaceae bacterium]